MLATEQIEAAIAGLRRRCRGDVVSASGRTAQFERDFGGIVRKRPAVILRPAGGEDVLAALDVASHLELPVSTRGSGHGQGGQSIGDGLVLDMRGLNAVHAVDAEQGWVHVDAGATWKTLVDHTFALGLMPTGLTQVLDTTV